jgi:DNA topoisomerase I
MVSSRIRRRRLAVAAEREDAAPMAPSGGWRRTGSKRRFRYVDAAGRAITDEAALERIRALAIPPAWTDVWISPRPRAKIQATGYDAAGRKQYRYHADYRARQEQAKYDKLVRFAERLPQLREAMGEHMALEGLPQEKVAAIAVRLINLGWFRVGSDRYARQSRTFGITTLRKRHVAVRGARIAFSYRGKHNIMVRSAIVDEELAAAVRDLVRLPGPHLFQYEADGVVCRLDQRKLNAYIRAHLGEEFTAKDFRTWGGTLIAAISFAQLEPPATAAEGRRRIAAVMRQVAAKLGNTPAVARSSYVSPAVVEQYLDGRTIEDFRPRHLRVVGARDRGLDPEEAATLSLLRSYRIRVARAAA